MISTSKLRVEVPFRSAAAPRRAPATRNNPNSRSPRRRSIAKSSSSSPSSDWENFNAAALKFIRERGERIKRVDEAVERALESRPRLWERSEQEEEEEEEEASRSTSTSSASEASSPLVPSPTSTSSSSSSLTARGRASSSPPPPPRAPSSSFSLEAFDEWHARAWAALGEAAAAQEGGGGEPAT